MARDTTPIVKQSRREGYALHPKAHKVLARKSGIPGQHSGGRQGKQSLRHTRLEATKFCEVTAAFEAHLERQVFDFPKLKMYHPS